MPVQQDQSKAFVFYILLTAVVCGALVMVIEVMGSRVIGPFFGVSLFVWTSLIAVTLVALALGYGFGGYLSDRYSSPRYLYLIIMLAGALTLLVPFLQKPVLQFCVPLGLRSGAFISTLILFGPQLFLLGCVSPYLVKIAASQLRNLGAVVGGLYALSTIGSTVGTIITGFLLVALLGVDKIFLVTGILLISLSAGYFLLFKRQWVAAAAVILPFALYHPYEFTSKILADGSELSKVAHMESFYGTLKVIDSKSTDKHSRYMMIDSLIQGGMDMKNGLSIYFYNYYLQFLPYMLHPAGTSCLVIGVGAGLVPAWYEQNGVTCDIVDIDQKVIQLAQQYFNFNNKGEVFTDDGRYYLASSPKQYDFLILDAFSGDLTPAHLLSKEALTSAKMRLMPQGVLAINIIGNLVGENFMTASVVKTMEEVFDQVEIYPAFHVNDSNAIGNVIIVAYQGEPRDFQPVDNKIFTIHPFFEKAIRDNLGTRFYFPAGTHAITLTDNYNPIDFYDFWLRELVRKMILDTIDWDLLAG
ncbi:MAG: fused MFS/spermidine synthase [Gammaproteobacteria bacterium]|nr:fused MFS/spermidine synthase [Gammaproteobacteria bacterium]